MSMVIPLDDKTTPDEADLITNEIDKVIYRATEEMHFYSDVAFMIVPNSATVPVADGAQEALRGIAMQIYAAMRRANQMPEIAEAVVIRGGPIGSEWDLMRRKVNGEDISKS
jgi:hypothetical protein|tara:strand:+ start:1259 stop:1594 length:336 start_codon:yes stop_codon:yes gene_type:complete